VRNLQKLPGVGPGAAEKITTYRQQIGRFNDISQIQGVSCTLLGR
jgi:DNA uptake protein ComE-like DNA-binding protein